MCFVTSCPKKCIADKNITCYKVVHPLKIRRRKYRFWKKAILQARSIVKGYLYTAWEDNPTVGLYIQDCSSVNVSRHVIERGYHSLTYIPKGHSEDVVKCIIPEGSIYYTNNVEYVSSNIIMTDEIL